MSTQADRQVKSRVWRRARWDWAYEFSHPRRGKVFGCGFMTRERAREAMAEARRHPGVSP